jgi:hypothetical protein
MRKYPLHRKRVDSLHVYEALDPDVAALILDAMRGNHWQLAEQSQTLRDHLPHFDKVFWRPGRGYYFGVRGLEGHGQRLVTYASVYFHEAVHQLFFERFGNSCFDRAVLCLLAEATASCVDIYFWLLIAAHRRFSAAQFFELVGVRESTPSRLRQVERQLRAMSDEAGRAQVLHSYQLTFLAFYTKLLALMDANRAGRTVGSEGVEKLTRSVPNAWVVKKFDFLNNVLYVKAYASKRFAANDYRRRLTVAARASSAAGYLTRLVAA